MSVSQRKTLSPPPLHLGATIQMQLLPATFQSRTCQLARIGKVSPEMLSKEREIKPVVVHHVICNIIARPNLTLTLLKNAMPCYPKIKSSFKVHRKRWIFRKALCTALQLILSTATFLKE